MVPLFFTGLVVAIVLLYFLSERNKSPQYKLRKGKTSSIRMVKEGDYVKLVGSIIPLKQNFLRTPITDRPCIGYSLLVEERLDRNRHLTIIQKQKTDNFLLDDGTGLAFINPEHYYTYEIEHDKHFSSGFLNSPEERLKAILTRFQTKGENFLGLNRNLQYYEGLIDPNYPVAVMGYATWKTAESLHLPAEYSGKKILVLKQGKLKKYLSNHKQAVKK